MRLKKKEGVNSNLSEKSEVRRIVHILQQQYRINWKWRQHTHSIGEYHFRQADNDIEILYKNIIK